MENSKYNKIEDLRQSKGWEEFLTWSNWKCIRTSSGSLISFSNSPVGKLAKVQRPPNLSLNDLKELDEICKDNKCTLLKLEPGLSQDISLIETSGYLKSPSPLLPPATIIIDLKKNQEELWGEVSKGGKYSIKRAQREGANIEIHKNPSRKVLDRFIALTNQTKNDRNYHGASKKDLMEKITIFKDNLFIIFVKNSSGADLVANMYLTHKDAVWYLHGGTSTEARKTKAGYELVWRGILYFKEKGFSYLDFDGIDDDRFPKLTKTWGRFSHFKEKFSKNRTYFPMPYVKIYNPALKFITKLKGKNTL